MTFSKWLLLLTATALVGCSTESNKKKEILVKSPHDFQSTGNFQVSTFKIIKSDRAASNAYNFVSQKTFNFEACLVDQLNAPIGQPNLEFTIADESNNEIRVVTDRRGCVVWSESPKLSYLMDETYFKLVRYVRSNNYYKGSVEMVGAFMPWYDDSAALLDIRYSDLPEGAPLEETQHQGLQGAHYRSSHGSSVRVNLKSASFKFTGLDYDKYEVTPLLGLKVAHKYQVKLSPTVIRKTIKGTMTPESFNVGSMRAVLVILREARSPENQFNVNQVVTSVEFEDDLLYGDLMADVSIPFPNVVDITSRTVALLTLTPMEELEGLPSMSFAGPLSPGLLSSLELKPVAQSALQLHRQFQEKLKNESLMKAKPLEIFKSMSKYAILETSAKVRPYPRRELKEVIEALLSNEINETAFSRTGAIVEICNQMYPDRSRGSAALAEQCRRDTKNFIDYKVLNFVERLNSSKPSPVGLPTVDTLKMAMSVTTSDTQTVSVGMNSKIGLSLEESIPLGIGSLKFSVGADHSAGRVKKIDTSTTVGASRERTVTAEGVSFQIDVTGRRCLVVESTQWLRERYPSATKGLYYCSDKVVRDPKHIETYYLLTSKTGVDGSPITDNAFNGSSPWKLMVRGTRTLNAFASILEKPFYQLVLEKLDTEDQLLQQFHELYLNQVFPGVLSEP